MTEIKAANPYDVLGNDFVDSVVRGNRGAIQGKQLGLPDRLRQFAYFTQENAQTVGDALLVNDLLDAARRLSAAPDATLAAAKGGGR